MNNLNNTVFEKNFIALLAIAILLSFFLPLGIVPLFDLDEGAFSEATREMLLNKDYITTYLNGELRFDKPILIYWFQALSVSVFGLNEFALRLPSAIASTLWAIAIFTFTNRYFDKKTALLGTFIFITSLQITIIAKAAIADGLLNLFIALSMFMIYSFYKTREEKYIYLTFVFIALGALTKGPVAILIPLVVSFLFFSIRSEFKLWIKTLFNLKGIAIFAVIALPWYILEYMAQGQLFIDGFFLKHNISRFNDAMEGHSGNYFYFIPVLILGLMPHTGVFIKFVMGIKQFFKEDLHLYLIIWFLFVFIFFSFSNTKLPHYIIYGYTPLFILMGIVLSKLDLNDTRFFKLYFIPPIILLSIFLFLPNIVDAIEIKDKFVNSFKDEIVAHFTLSYQLTIALILLFLIVLFLRKNISLFTKIIASGILTITTINFIIMPNVASVQQQPIKDIALYVKEKDLQVTMYRMNNPTFNVYAERLVKKEEPISGEYVITKKLYLSDFPKGYEIIYDKMGIVFVKLK